MNSKISKVGS